MDKRVVASWQEEKLELTVKANKITSEKVNEVV